jgi:hypothetical protein
MTLNADARADILIRRDEGLLAGLNLAKHIVGFVVVEGFLNCFRRQREVPGREL